MSNNFESKSGSLLRQSTIVIDWYDGIISALVKFTDVHDWFLMSMAAWDLNQSSKVYTLKTLSPSILEELLKKFKVTRTSQATASFSGLTPSAFKKLRAWLNDFYNTGGFPEYVVLVDHSTDNVIRVKRLSNIKIHHVADVEEPFNNHVNNIKFWYVLFDQSPLDENK
jgi:hypothetical protein